MVRHPASARAVPNLVVLGLVMMLSLAACASSDEPTDHSAAPGFRTVMSHGLAMDVPESFTVRNSTPCVVSSDIVVLGTGSSAACGAAAPPRGVTIVDFTDAIDVAVIHDPSAEVTSSQVRLGGQNATRTQSTYFSHLVVSFVVPALRSSVVIIAANDHIARQLEATLRPA
jgi:hypothetical protein